MARNVLALTNEPVNHAVKAQAIGSDFVDMTTWLYESHI